MKGLNEITIDRVASSILTLLGVEKGEGMAEAIEELLALGRCDRVVMYNPDAVAEWIYEAHRDMFSPLLEEIDLNLEMKSMVPPVTPVCFASMYTGLLPSKHGIEKYEKPVLKVKTAFDILRENGRKVAIVSTEGDSISKIFLERDLDYFIYRTKEECNRKALELIDEDRYDLLVLYNGDYDWAMHRFSPEGKRSLRALVENVETYMELKKAIEERWKGHRTALAFAPDHGCHRAYGILGSHGKEIPMDMNIRHFWSIIGERDA